MTHEQAVANVRWWLQIVRAQARGVRAAMRRAVRVAVAALLHVTGYTRVAMRLADRLPESASTEPRGAHVSELLSDAPMLRKLWRKVRGVESRACD